MSISSKSWVLKEFAAWIKRLRTKQISYPYSIQNHFDPKKLTMLSFNCG